MAHLYYDNSLTAADLVPGNSVTVSGQEAHHAVTVGRLRPTEKILLGNETGVLAQVLVTEVVAHGSSPEFTAQVVSSKTVASPAVELVLVQALAKGGRDEMAVQQATEFGVQTVIPWQAQRSIAVWAGSAKVAKGQTKWQRIAREAAKQSLRAHIPQVLPPHGTKELVALAADPQTLMLVLDPWQAQRLSAVVKKLAETDSVFNRVIFVVGPEGGIAQEELQDLTAVGATAVVVGEHVLRTSSAAAAALAVTNVVLGRW